MLSKHHEISVKATEYLVALFPGNGFQALAPFLANLQVGYVNRHIKGMTQIAAKLAPQPGIAADAMMNMDR